jgi:hypothetical protein
VKRGAKYNYKLGVNLTYKDKKASKIVADWKLISIGKIGFYTCLWGAALL